MSTLPYPILIMGAGNIGTTVATLLAETNDYQVFIGDIQPPRDLPTIPNNPIHFLTTDIQKKAELMSLIKQHKIVAIVSCLPYHLTIKVAEIAAECGIHYFDPTEDVATTQAVLKLSQNSKGCFAPQCGLAPGFISIVTHYLIEGFDSVDRVKMRVGALTQSVSNDLFYALTWSTEGLINEYLRPCIVLENSVQKEVSPLGGLEEIVLDGERYEAFHTSGGVGSLVITHAHKVKHMDYKTIRYPGHCDRIRFLLQDLRLGEKPALVKQIFEHALPHSEQDVVIIYVSVQGMKNGRLFEKSYAKKFYPVELAKQRRTAIQMTTATGICGVIDLVVHEKKFNGFLKQEQIHLTRDFFANRFGAYYHKEGV